MPCGSADDDRHHWAHRGPCRRSHRRELVDLAAVRLAAVDLGGLPTVDLAVDLPAVSLVYLSAVGLPAVGSRRFVSGLR